MDDDRAIGGRAKDAELQWCAVSGRPDDHDQLIALTDRAHHVVDSVPDVLIGDAVLARWLSDPHLDNMPCLKHTALASLRSASDELGGDARRPDLVVAADYDPGLRYLCLTAFGAGPRASD